MPHIIVTLKGRPNDHEQWSPELSQEETEAALDKLGVVAGTGGRARLPWGVFAGAEVISARIAPESREVGVE